MKAQFRPLCMGVLLACCCQATACMSSGKVSRGSTATELPSSGSLKQDTLRPILPPAPPVIPPAEQADFGENEFSAKAVEDRCETAEPDSMQKKNP